MEGKTDISKLSRVDELTVRKAYLEGVLSETKKQLKDNVMLLLAGALVDNSKEKIEGMAVFIERWIKDIEVEIENL